jgi:dynein heavy chain
LSEEEKNAEKKTTAAQGSADEMSDSNSDIDEKAKAQDEEPEVEYHQIMIATGDSIANSHLLDLLMRHEFPMMLVGGTGVGKTRQIKKYIGGLVNSGEWESGEMVLSATESAENLFKYTQSKMDKHKKGLYGPKNPGNKLVMFIDDLNMPAKEKYGA